MTRIYRFEVGRARRGGVYCQSLDITFPALFRVVQSLSREQLDDHGLTDVEPIDRYVHYTIREDTPQGILGTVECGTMRGIPDPDAPSLVVRWHPTEERASAYLEAVLDLRDDDSTGEICRTKDGLFTLAERSTNPDWPGPLVIYLAEHPANNIVGTEIWYLALAPDGAAIQLSDYEVPGS
jgi:hypothetical protein